MSTSDRTAAPNSPMPPPVPDRSHDAAPTGSSPNFQRYLRPEVARQIRQLDLRARCIVKGFLSGLHRSIGLGASNEFDDYREYRPGDDIRGIDWNLYSRTDKYYVRKYRAETNLTATLMLDVSESMGYTHTQEMTKFEYSMCLAAALAYLVTQRRDQVGLIMFDTVIRRLLPARSSRTHLGEILSLLTSTRPTGRTDLGRSLEQSAATIRRGGLILVFSDLLGDVDNLLRALCRMRATGSDVIVFHILDEAEVSFPFTGMVEFVDPESGGAGDEAEGSGDTMTIDADACRADYLEAIAAFRSQIAARCAELRIDYLPLDTSMQFDRALLEYLVRRQKS